MLDVTETMCKSISVQLKNLAASHGKFIEKRIDPLRLGGQSEGVQNLCSFISYRQELLRAGIGKVGSVPSANAQGGLRLDGGVTSTASAGGLTRVFCWAEQAALGAEPNSRNNRPVSGGEGGKGGRNGLGGRVPPLAFLSPPRPKFQPRHKAMADCHRRRLGGRNTAIKEPDEVSCRRRWEDSARDDV